MWYVIQVPTGQEEQIIEEAKKYEVTEFLTELFTPRWENQKKIQGEWKELTGVIFPGYLFVITETPEALYQTLKRIPRLTKLLGTGEKYFSAGTSVWQRTNTPNVPGLSEGWQNLCDGRPVKGAGTSDMPGGPA